MTSWSSLCSLLFFFSDDLLPARLDLAIVFVLIPFSLRTMGLCCVAWFRLLVGLLGRRVGVFSSMLPLEELFKTPLVGETEVGRSLCTILLLWRGEDDIFSLLPLFRVI